MLRALTLLTILSVHFATTALRTGTLLTILSVHVATAAPHSSKVCIEYPRLTKYTINHSCEVPGQRMSGAERKGFIRLAGYDLESKKPQQTLLTPMSKKMTKT